MPIYMTSLSTCVIGIVFRFIKVNGHAQKTFHDANIAIISQIANKHGDKDVRINHF